MRKTILILFFFTLLSSYSNAQNLYPILDQYGQSTNFTVNSLRSKIPIFVAADRQTKAIVPFNMVPDNPLGSMVYLLDATSISVTTLIKKDSIRYYRYSIFENDTTVIRSESQLSKIDFDWPEGSDCPGYLTMNLGISSIRNKKITIKIYRLPEESKVTTVIIYNKRLNQARLAETNLLRESRIRKIPFGNTTMFRVLNNVTALKNGIQLDVDRKTRGIRLVMKKTDLDFVYHVILKKKVKTESDIVFLSNNWSYTGHGDDPLNFIPASYFSTPGTYELLVIPIIGRASDKTVIDTKPIRISFTVIKPPITFSTSEIMIGGMITILLAAIAFLLIRRKNKQKLALANRQAEIAKTELNNVRSQLNPHFVFNALSAIQNLMNQNKVEKANGYLVKFSRLTRNILDGKQLIALKDEYKLLDDYLSMEQLRFDFNYEIKVNTVIDILEVMIPAMLLQPFLENATKHCMSVLGDKGNLLVEFQSVNRHLIISVKDNGHGFDVQKVHKGLGLSLCKKRIDLLNQMYGECPVSMELHSDPNGTTVIITLNNWL